MFGAIAFQFFTKRNFASYLVTSDNGALHPAIEDYADEKRWKVFGQKKISKYVSPTYHIRCLKSQRSPLNALEAKFRALLEEPR